MKNHETYLKNHGNQPKTTKNHETTLKHGHGTMKNQSGTIKTNLELDRVVLGVQVVTGDSQEEVMIFRYKQTLHYYPTRARSAWVRRACALIYIHHDYCCHHHNHCCHDHNHHNHCCHLHNHCCHDHNHHDYCCHHHNHRKQHHHRCERNPNRANIEEVANLVSEALKKFQTK